MNFAAWSAGAIERIALAVLLRFSVKHFQLVNVWNWTAGVIQMAQRFTVSLPLQHLRFSETVIAQIPFLIMLYPRMVNAEAVKTRKKSCN